MEAMKPFEIARRLIRGGDATLLTTITARFFVWHAVVTAMAFLLLGPSRLVSYPGTAAVLLLDAALWLSLRLSDRRDAPIILTASWFMLLFFLPRITQFQVFPASTIGFVALEPFTSAEVEKALAYITAGYLALWGGVRGVSTWILAAEGPSSTKKAVPVASLAIYAGLAFAATFYIYFVVDVSVYSVDPSKWGSRLGWISIIFNIDVALLGALTWLLLHPAAPARERTIPYLIVIIWLIVILALGSRGGPLRVMILVGLGAIALHGNPRTSLPRVLLILALAFLTSAAMYPLATVIRFSHASGDDAVGALKNDWYRKGKLEDADLWPLRKYLGESAAYSKAASTVSPVITRLGLIDYPIAIISREPDRAVTDHYLALSYSLKNFANNMVPGELFPKHDVMTSRVFTMAYRGFGEQHVRKYFLSEPWTLWGFSWLKGGWFGGLLLIAGLAAVAQGGYAAALRLSGPTFAPYAGTTYLFIPVIAGLLQLFGVDHALTVIAHFTLATLVFFAIAWIFLRNAPDLPDGRAAAKSAAPK